MFVASTDLQTRRARCQHQLSFLCCTVFKGSFKSDVAAVLLASIHVLWQNFKNVG